MPTIFSLSYGECEAAGFVDGTVQEAGDLWSQAAAQGVTVFVSTGDAGSAGCDQNETAAYQGIAVNAMASTPYNVAVGGTDFNDYQQQTQYWSASNSALYGSALSYIPEQTWNTSCASNTLYTLLGFSDGVTACNSTAGQQYLNTGGGSGGASNNWFQPLWQVGIYGRTTMARVRCLSFAVRGQRPLRACAGVLHVRCERGWYYLRLQQPGRHFIQQCGRHLVCSTGDGRRTGIDQPGVGWQPSGNILTRALYNHRHQRIRHPQTRPTRRRSTSVQFQQRQQGRFASCVFNNVTVVHASTCRASVAAMNATTAKRPQSRMAC